MEFFEIHAGRFKLDGGAMFGVVPKSMWQKLNQPDDNNMCSWAMRCLLVKEGNRLMLIDNGMGTKQDDKFFGHYYLHGNESLDQSLAEHGFHKDDITDVFLTHLHFDHCGGSIERKGDMLVPAFKNARFWSNRKHWDWAVNPNAREKASFLKENILPIQESGQLNFVEEAKEVFPGMKIEMVSGHTESMMLPIFNYKGKPLMYMADLLPSAAHIPLPYVMAYDTRPLLTLDEKKRILEWCLTNEALLFFEHDKDTACGTLTQTEKGIRLLNSGSLTDF
jgi:glyoxylase-like metal-dependent hydrolase (beta-lactamase superfamily II)